MLAFITQILASGAAKKVLSWLKDPKVWVAIALFATLFLVYRHYDGLQDKIKEQAQTIATLNQRVLTVEAEKARCQDVNAENKRDMDKFRETALNTQKDFNELTELLKNQKKDTDKKVAAIIAGPKPETCQATIDYLVDSAMRRSQP